MKKITSILALFLMVLGINAQVNVNSLEKVNANKCYTLTATRSALCVTPDTTAVMTLKNTGLEANPADPQQQFAFVNPAGTSDFYLYSVSAKQFVQKNNSLNATSGDPVNFVDASSKRADAVMINMGAGLNFNINSVGNLVIDSWSTADDGNDFIVCEAGDFDPTEALAALQAKQFVDVTYVYMLDGEQIKVNVVKQEVGSAYAAPSIHNLITMTYPDENTVSPENKDIFVTCTENLPFTKSADFASATWYSMTIAKDKYYLSYVADATSIVLDRQETTGENKDAWCFVGNVLDGFKVYNKAAGENMILSSPTDMSAGDGNTFPILVDANNVPEGNNTTWDFTDGRNWDGVQGYFMAQHGFASNRVNKRGTNLAYWTGGADDGSTILFNEVVVLTDAEIIAKFVEDNAAVANYVGGYTKEQLDAVSQFTTIAELDAFRQNAKKVRFDDGQFYRIKNYCRDLSISNAAVNNEGGYMGDNQMVGDSVSCHTKSLADATCLWTLEKVGDNFLIKNLNSGKYIGKTAANSSQYLAQVVSADSAGVYNVVDLGNAQFNLVCTNGEGQHNQLHASSPRKAGPGVMNWNAGANSASAWHFVPANEIEVNMNRADSAAAETWASLYLPFGVKVAGVQAFAGKVNGDVMNLTEVSEVPANYGVILKGTDDVYTLEIANVAASAVANDLTGSNVQVDKVAGSLVLGNGVQGVGMYAPTGEVMKANKAYAVVSPAAAANGLKFVFGETTGVEGVEVETENAVYYDLSGRRVANPVKGIYVVNGKKVLVK